MTQNSSQIINTQTFSLIQPKTHNIQSIHQNTSQIKDNQLNQIHQGKLCNDQQYGDLNGTVSKRDWTQQEDELVYRLHNQFGNKWAIIAEQLKGRTDNCIKNHFYSRLRKGLRKINKLIQDSYKQSYKEFKIIDLYKVIQASDQKFKEINSYPNQMTDIGHDLKNRLFIYAEGETDGTQEFDIKIKKLLDDLNDFTKNYKRKSKKSRRYSPMGVGSVYRNNKKGSNITQNDQEDQQKIEQQKQTIEKVQIKTQPIVKVEEQYQKKQRKIKQKKEINNLKQPKLLQVRSQMNPITTKKQISPAQFLLIEEPGTIKGGKSRNTYRQFSDDQGEQKDQADYVKQQKLNHFAQNILKTFKSYYSFKSFKSNGAMDELLFQ